MTSNGSPVSRSPAGTGRDRSPFARPRWLAAAAFLVVIVVLAFVVVLASRGGPAPSAAPPGQAPSVATPGQPAASPARTQAGPSGCSLPAADQAVPAAAPAGVRWEIYDTVALPFSATAGPQVVAGDVARCYAHTPVGALLAAVQIAVRYVLAASWRTVLAEQVVPGPGAGAYAAQRDQDPAVDTTQPGQYGQIAGFAFIAYTPAVAVMQIVSRLPGGTLQVTAMTTQWSGGDWRLVLHPDGSPGGTVQQLPDLGGFIPWGGV